jgi:DNA-binding transcriptional LysR family regulator
MDRLNAMAILVASAQERSCSAARPKLGIPLPTVSRKIADLETYLKVKLFVRSRRKKGGRFPSIHSDRQHRRDLRPPAD